MFDLRTSPFYLLGVSPRDNHESIAEATENAISEATLDEAAATRAQQVLMSPRLRLKAELSWLPGLAPNRAKQLIEADSLALNAIAGLPLLAGANLAAHRCSSRSAPVHHELLFSFYKHRDDDKILNSINSDRRVAQFPEVSLDLLNEIMPDISEQHSAAFIEFVSHQQWPGATLLSVLEENFVDGSNLIGFLDDLVQRFDNWATGLLKQSEDSITRALHAVQDDPASLDKQMPAFTAAILAWTAVAAPHQFILARRHLNDPRTEQLLGKIREVCLHLNNNVGDATTPLALTKVAVPAFERSPGHLDIVKADLKALEERVVENEALKALEPLLNILTDLKSRHSEVCRSIRRGNFKPNGKGVAGKLFDLFQMSAKNLATTQASDAPFRTILSLAIDLVNDSQASEEALILIRALQAFNDVPKSEKLTEDLGSNGLIAHRTVIQKNLIRMAEARRNWQSARLAQQLADTATDDEDRAGWAKVQARFHRRAKIETCKYAAIALGLAGLVGFAIVEDNKSISPTQYQTSTFQDSAAAYYNRGYEFAKNGQYEQAIVAYSEAIRMKPSYAAAYHGRGIAHANKKQYTQAIGDYDQALRFEPNNATALLGRGLAHAILGQNDQAVQDYSKAISLNPTNFTAFNFRGNAYLRNGDIDKAISDYNEAIQLNPENSYAFTYRGFAYLRSKNVERAIGDFDRAITIDPSNMRAFSGRGHARAQSGQYDLAISDYTHMIERNSDDFSPFVGRSLAYLAHGDLQLALADCEQAMRLAPTRKDLIENRALVYLRQGRVDLAMNDFETALESNPQLPWSLFARGIIRLRRGDARGKADIASAQSFQSDVGKELDRYGIRR